MTPKQWISDIWFPESLGAPQLANFFHVFFVPRPQWMRQSMYLESTEVPFGKRWYKIKLRGKICKGQTQLFQWLFSIIIMLHYRKVHASTINHWILWSELCVNFAFASPRGSDQSGALAGRCYLGLSWDLWTTSTNVNNGPIDIKVSIFYVCVYNIYIYR